MNKCLSCKFAKWDRTEAGRLHPGKQGQCTFKYALPPLPACMYWIGGSGPKPCGWRISRADLIDACPVYEEKHA